MLRKPNREAKTWRRWWWWWPWTSVVVVVVVVVVCAFCDRSGVCNATFLLELAVDIFLALKALSLSLCESLRECCVHSRCCEVGCVKKTSARCFLPIRSRIFIFWRGEGYVPFSCSYVRKSGANWVGGLCRRKRFGTRGKKNHSSSSAFLVCDQ